MWTKVSNSIDTLPDGKLLPVKVNSDCNTKKESEHSGACSSTGTPRSSTFTSPFSDIDSCDQTRRPTIMQHQHQCQYQNQNQRQYQNQHPVDDDAPWDEALSFSPISASTCTSDRPKLTVKIPSSTSTEGTTEMQSNNPILSNLPIDHNDDCSLLQVHTPEPEAAAMATPMTVTVKSKSRPKKRSKKLETGNDVEPNCPEPVSISSESGYDKDSLPREVVPNPSNSKPRNTLDNSSSHEKLSIKTPTNSTKKSTRESLKNDTKPLSFIIKDSKPLGEEDVSSVASSTKTNRKSRMDTKQQVERITHSQEEPQVVTNTKPKTKGNAARSTTTKGVVNETRSILSSNSASLVDQIPDLACSDLSESKDIDDRSLGSLNSSTMMDSLTSLESQNNGSDLRTKADSVNGRKGRRRNKQSSEGSLFFPSALHASSTTFSARCNDSNARSKSGTSQDGSTPKNRLTVSSSTNAHLDSDSDSDFGLNAETFEHSTSDLQDLMPPLKPKSLKGNQQESQGNNTINASEILKKKIMQMNESLRLKAFHGDSCSSLQSESSLEQSLSSKSDHGITTRRPRRTLSGNEGKFRQSCPPENCNNNPSDIVMGDPPSTRRRRKSVDGSSTRQREKVDTSTVKEARRRPKVKGKDEESGRSNKVESKSPRRNHGRDTVNVSSRSLSKSDANATSSSWQETTAIAMTELDVPTITTTTQPPTKQGKNKSSSSKKSNAKDSNKATHTSRSESSNDSGNSGPCPEIATDEEKDATTTSGKSKSPKSHRKDKDAKPSSQSQLLRGKDRSYSFTSTGKIESIQKKEDIIRSRSQSPSRKGKRQPKSLLNPETLDAWQISQQQKHRVTPFPSVYCRRLDDDDDDDDDGLNPALLLPPAFRQLQVAQKPKSSRF